MPDITSSNVYGDPSLRDKLWQLRHDDEIWTVDDEFVAHFTNAPDAEWIVILHNAALAEKAVTPEPQRVEPRQ